ncbi:hypothetical protein BAJUN_02260 [Bajunvirus bajun]|uniref:Minor capsid protein n=1 Tax=Brevundimonas phage vB_BgoS-Bajun TaxID=2948594 RepID=A0A9E7STD5_9CAUD|nr:hypothetical protein BAJUN_02260 [Brevundimonas phage vB_BgoS-Bajun]
MESKIRHQYDADLALRAPGSAAITATTATGAVDIYRLDRARGVQGRYGIGSFDIVIHFGALDTTTGDETYFIDVETVDANGANAVVQATVPVVAGNLGEPIVLGFHPSTFAAKDPDAAKVRLNVRVAGTTPSATFYAFLAPHSHY